MKTTALADRAIGRERRATRRWCGWAWRCAVLLLPATLCVSCATSGFWDAHDPKAVLFIPDTEISEAELARKGVTYEKIEGGLVENHFGHHSANVTGGYVIEKSTARKAQDHALRVVGTPVTLVVDGVVGVSATAYGLVAYTPALEIAAGFAQ